MARQIKWLDKTAKKMPPNRHLPSGKLLFGPNRSTVSGAPLTRFALSSNKKERKKLGKLQDTKRITKANTPSI